MWLISVSTLSALASRGDGSTSRAGAKTAAKARDRNQLSVVRNCLTIGLIADYHEICASNPGDRCLVRAARVESARIDVGKQRRGRGKSELRRAMCSLTARVGGGLSPRRHVRLRHGKCHRKYTALFD